MECPLGQGPLGLSFLSPVILLRRKGRLPIYTRRVQYASGSIRDKGKGANVVYDNGTLLWRRLSHALPLRMYRMANLIGSRGRYVMTLYSQTTPAHPHPQPLIRAKPQFAYTAINVATCSTRSEKLNLSLSLCIYSHINLYFFELESYYQLSDDEGGHKEHAGAF